MVGIYNEDCLTFLPKLEDKTFDMVLIDPPYIISKDSGYVNNAPDKTDYISKYGKHSIDFGEWDKQELDLQFVLSELYRVLKDNGTLLCFYDIWKFQEFKETAEKIGFKQPRIGTWNKTNPVPINSKLNYLSNAKEYFCTFVKKSKPTFNSEYDNGDYFVENSDTYQLPILHGKERLKHPTQKPLALIKALVEKHTNKGDMVLDCFAGTGTTGVACLELDRECVMCEKDKNYYEMANSRIAR